MTGKYTLAGYNLCGHIVPVHYKSALFQFLYENYPCVRGTHFFKLADMTDEDKEKVVSEWLEIEKGLDW